MKKLIIILLATAAVIAVILSVVIPLDTLIFRRLFGAFLKTDEFLYGNNQEELLWELRMTIGDYLIRKNT